MKSFVNQIKYIELLKQLVLKDIKLKYRRSYLGYIWSILNPLLMMIVLTVVFSNLFKFDIPNFSAYLLTGQLIFGFVSEATSSSVTAIVHNLTQVEITLNVLWVPIIFLELYIFSLGLGFILSASTVFFRDIQYLWGVFTSIWMYLTPIIYPVSIISQEYRWWYDNLNPMVNYVEQFRNVILNSQSLSMESLSQGFIISIILLLVGIWFFNRKENEFILYI